MNFTSAKPNQFARQRVLLLSGKKRKQIKALQDYIVQVVVLLLLNQKYEKVSFIYSWDCNNQSLEINSVLVIVSTKSIFWHFLHCACSSSNPLDSTQFPHCPHFSWCELWLFVQPSHWIKRIELVPIFRGKVNYNDMVRRVRKPWNVLI